MTSYNKPHLTYQQQLELLKYRGLVVKDEQFAIIKLQHISYYRLNETIKQRFVLTLSLYDPTQLPIISPSSSRSCGLRSVKKCFLSLHL